MARKGNPDLELVIYLGTGKLAAFEGIAGEGEPRILRYKCIPDPRGFEGGRVKDLAHACQTLRFLANEFYGESAGDISCYVVLGNRKLRNFRFSSSQYFQTGQRAVSPLDIRSVVKQTRSVATLPLSEHVLQAIPESFTVNDLEGIVNPLGLEAHRLGAHLNLMTMDFEDFKNISKAFELAELKPEGYFPKPLTLGEAVLTEEEREEGALILDFADDMTSGTLWKDGILLKTQACEIGGRLLTEKIAQRWNIPFRDAQKVKEQYASLETNPHFGDELIALVERDGKTAHPIRRQEFHEAFQQFFRDWVKQILDWARPFASGGLTLNSRTVITGGAAGIDGFLEYLQRGFSLDAKIGLARRIEAPHEILVDSSLAGALGMFLWLRERAPEHSALMSRRGLLEKSLASARDWFSSYF